VLTESSLSDRLAGRPLSTEPLAARNWILFRETDDFEAATPTLADTLDTDLDWVRAHTRVLTRALEFRRSRQGW
jgi:hypothetical protein